MLHGIGYQTGVNLPALVEVGQWITSKLQRTNESRAGRAHAAQAVLRKKKSEKEKHQA